MFFYRRLIAVVAVVASVASFSVSDFSATAVGYSCTISGSVGSETLTGTSGNDVICTNGGNDVVNAGGGNDVILVTGGGNVQVNAGDGDDRIDASLAASLIANGGLGNDTITGTPGNDTIDAGTGTDIVDAGAGDDTVTGSAGEILTVDLGDGDDTFTGGSAADVTVEGGLGNDTIAGTANSDTLNGGGGNDTITGLAGDDDVDAGAGDDVVDGGLGSDQLVAGEGADTLNGGEGNDRLEGDAGPDNLYGEAGIDTLLGNDGDDIIAGGDGVDSLDGGWGLNVCDFSTGEPPTSTCTYDDSPPTFLEITVDRTSVDVGISNQVVTFQVEVTDETRVQRIDINCGTLQTFAYWETYPPSGYIQRDFLNWGRYTNYLGTNRHPIIEMTAGFPAGSAPGNYQCSLTLTDVLGHVRSVPQSSLPTFSVTRTGGNWDDSPPQFVTASVDRSSVEVGTSTQIVTFTVEALDATRIQRIDISCGPLNTYVYWETSNPAGYIQRDFLNWGRYTNYTGTANHPVVTMTAGVELGSSPGSYPCSMSITDPRGNRADVPSNMLPTITVTRTGGNWDESPPVFVSASVDRHVVDVGTSNQTMFFTISAEDATGINMIYFSCSNPDAPAGAASMMTLVRVPNWSEDPYFYQWRNPISVVTQGQRESVTFQSTIRAGSYPGDYYCQASLDDGIGNSSSISSSFLPIITVLRAPPGMPSAPAGLVYTPSDQRSGVLSWDVPSFVGDPGLRDYQIESSRDGVSWTRINDGFSTTLSLPLSNLAGGQTYFFRVRGENGGGDVAFSPGAQWSDVLEVRTPDPVAPLAPVGLSVSQVSASGAMFSWRAPSFDGGASISDFRVEVSSNGGVSWREVPHAALASTSFTVSGLSPGTNYRVRVAGVNSAGVGQFVTGMLTTAARVADAPRNVRVSNVTASTLSLGWDLPVSNGGKPITDYKVEVSSNGLTWTSIPHGASNSRTFNVSNLRAGTTYRFRISAVTLVGPGVASLAVSAVTIQAAPGVPTGLRAVNTSTNQTELRWTRPGLLGGSSVTDYTVQYSTNNGQTWTAISHTASTSQSMTVSGLQGVTTYQFRVAAKNSTSTGSYTDPVTVTTAGVLSEAPTNVVVGSITDTSVALSWTAPATIPGMTVTDYKVEYSSNNGSTWQTFTHAASTTPGVTVTGLNAATNYLFRLAALNELGWSESTRNVYGATIASLPSAPTILQVNNITSSSAQITFGNFDLGGGSFVSGRLQISPDGGSQWSDWPNVEFTEGQASITGLQPETNYLMRISVFNQSGLGQFSEPVSITTLMLYPGAPSSLELLVGSILPHSAQISWQAPTYTGASGLVDYTIEFSIDGGGTWSTYSHSPTIATQMTLVGLQQETDYLFRISAKNLNGSSVPSTNLEFSTHISAPTLLSTRISKTSGGDYLTSSTFVNTDTRWKSNLAGGTVSLAYQPYSCTYAFGVTGLSLPDPLDGIPAGCTIIQPDQTLGSLYHWAGVTHDQINFGSNAGVRYDVVIMKVVASYLNTSGLPSTTIYLTIRKGTILCGSSPCA